MSGEQLEDFILTMKKGHIVPNINTHYYFRCKWFHSLENVITTTLNKKNSLRENSYFKR